jgi:hypothetical protein
VKVEPEAKAATKAPVRKSASKAGRRPAAPIEPEQPEAKAATKAPVRKPTPAG